MYHSGIAGGGFMVVRSSNGSYEFIDFRETAPAAAYEDMYEDNVDASMFGGLAVSVDHHFTSAALTGFEVGFQGKFVVWNICTKTMVNCPGHV